MIDIDNLIKNYFNLSTNDEVQKIKKLLKNSDALFSFVLNQNKDSIIDADIYVHKNNLNIFLASFDTNTSYHHTHLTLEDELYFNENKILQEITPSSFSVIRKNVNILVVDNNYSLNNIISKFLFNITNAYYKEKIYENKSKKNIIFIKHKYTIGYNNNEITYYDRKYSIYKHHKYDIKIIDHISPDKITIKNKEEYVIKYILNDILFSNRYSDFFIISNEIYFLNFFNEYTYSKIIEDLTKILKNKIDIKRLLFNTIKLILKESFDIEVNQYKFIKNKISNKIKKNIFVQFIINHNLFAFDHYDYVDYIEYRFKKYVEDYLEDYEADLISNIDSNINITIKNIDFKDKTGFDLINQKDINVKKYIKEDNKNIVIVLNEKNITLISKEDLDTYVSNINENWLFNCNRDDPEEVIENPFIQIPTSGGNIFVSYSDLYNLFISTAQIFFFNKTETMEKSQSFKNTIIGLNMGIANYVSANHCQDGSILGIYGISELQTDSKIKTFKSIKSLREPIITRSKKSSFFSERKAKSLTK